MLFYRYFELAKIQASSGKIFKWKYRLGKISDIFQVCIWSND